MGEDLYNLLITEKRRLNDSWDMFYEQYREAMKPAIKQGVLKTIDGNEVNTRYLDVDNMAPEKYQVIEQLTKQLSEVNARKQIFNEFIKKAVSPDKYKKDDEPQDFSDLKIDCSLLEMDEHDNFIGACMIVANIVVGCPEVMTYEEYSDIYTEGMTTIITNVMETMESPEEAVRVVSEACERVYLEN